MDSTAIHLFRMNIFSLTKDIMSRLRGHSKNRAGKEDRSNKRE